MKKCITGFILCLIMIICFSLEVEAANKVIFNSEDNNYSVELLVDKNKIKLESDDIDDLEDFYNIKIKENKESYIIIKEYEDFIQINPETFTEEWNTIVKNLLGNDGFKFSFNEEVVSFLYSGVRYFTVNIDGLTDDLNFEINIPNEYISFFSDTSELSESEKSDFNKIEFNLNNDNKEFIIQTINYSNIKSAIVSTDLSQDEVVTEYQITYKENVPNDILSAIGTMLNLSEITVDSESNTVKFKTEYENANYFSALHYRDLYNYLGIIAQVEMKDSGVYSKNKDLDITFYDIGEMDNIQYQVTNSKGGVKLEKGDADNKENGKVTVSVKNDTSYKFSTSKTNSYAIVVTIIVTIMFSVLFIFAYLLYKRSR